MEQLHTAAHTSRFSKTRRKTVRSCADKAAHSAAPRHDDCCFSTSALYDWESDRIQQQMQYAMPLPTTANHTSENSRTSTRARVVWEAGAAIERWRLEKD